MRSIAHGCSLRYCPYGYRPGNELRVFERVVDAAGPAAAQAAGAEPGPEAGAGSAGVDGGELSFKEEMWDEDSNDFVPSD